MEQTPTRQGDQFPLDTDSFAALNRVKAASVRCRVCRIGHYFGITPVKLANNRLAWPSVQVLKGGD